MVRAVIFDWYGTLAEREHAGVSGYAAVLSKFGYTADARVIDDYYVRWDGVDHRAHSVSRVAYAAWTRERLRELVRDCGVADAEREAVVEAMLASEDDTTLLAYPDAIPTLRALREHGIVIGVCSNWGWDLETFLEATGVAPFVDVAVTSARAGYRKPHRGIYELMLRSVGVHAHEAVFVGDSWGPDVVGPTGVGMAAVHVLRDPSRAAPELLPRAQRVGALDELLSIAPLRVR